MLLFIKQIKHFCPVLFDFNTSHVTVYPYEYDFYSKRVIDFNTSHVTVYRKWHKLQRIFNRFQYIPCYCLSYFAMFKYAFKFISIHPMLLFIHKRILYLIKLFHFNTSHVTVYRKRSQESS